MSKKQSKDVEQERAEWVCNNLVAGVTLEQFKEHASKVAAAKGGTTPLDGTLRGDFSRLAHGICAALRKMGVPVVFEGGRIQTPIIEPTPFSTEKFPSEEKAQEKRQIGTLVAAHLKKKPWNRLSVLLGSGTTVYWVGRAIGEQGNYSQVFHSINIPVLAHWSKMENAPVKKVTVPEGVFDIETFRYGSMNDFTNVKKVGIAVIGADSCLYDAAKPSVELFANEVPVGQITNRIVLMAVR